MKSTHRKTKLNLNRESLVELNPDALPIIVGGAGEAAGDDHRSYAVICLYSNNGRSCVGCR